MQLIDRVNLVGLRGFKVNKLVLLPYQGRARETMKFFDAHLVRVRDISVHEFVETFVTESLRTVPEMIRAMGHVDSVENTCHMMLQALIMSYEAVTGRRLPPIARDHVVEKVREIYTRLGIAETEHLG